ncbi:MAG TPA: class II fumarate hydratase [Denitromonas sp.]|uniref:class II fumarate hydratase n=1 Tax=Denitromonas sp. TaxID=2734609 RepID=UPI001DF3610E|nr:class II fumarate hydratase [Rhodocyclaceae bacterium]MCP5221570.1 class II fumarate hydratase [Zoogloeaceae bacterium]HQU87736.1 class II fumarate hydratase [Denitromonas sp.]HQV15970.1 class II fumarate hydratase [Denitromonas sp.]
MARTEHDSLGPVEVADTALWGAQTERARGHFQIGHERMPLALIRALAQVKAAAAGANAELGRLDVSLAAAIVSAAEEVIAGQHDAHFPLPVWQTGSGTQTHMNMNEVLANRASELLGGERGAGRRVHPNDHVNLGQSSNDVFPTAMHVAVSVAVAEAVLPALAQLRVALASHAVEFADIVKIGRTHLQDATPLTFGQVFSGYVAQLDLAAMAIAQAQPAVLALAIGGTAVGTGLNTPKAFGPAVAARLAEVTGLSFVCADNRFAALAGHEPLVALHGAIKTLAAALYKIANDLRWLASGPRCGIGELSLPANEPGSSIMPGKVNPTQCEALTMVCTRVFGNDVTVGMAGAAGNFELNVFKPVIAHAVLESIELLADSMRSFEQHCVAGLTANRERIDDLLARSLMLVTALTPHIGYDASAAIAKQAHAEGLSLREAAVRSGQLSAEDFDRWVRPENMV